MTVLSQSGFQIERGVFSADEIGELRSEADRVAKEAGSVCVRHLNARSGLFTRLSCSDTLLNLMGGSVVVPVRSILFDKTPHQNWPVAWHQDLTISVGGKMMAAGYGPWSVKDGVVHVQPPSALLEQMITVRIHLDETSAGNGALKVIPGSHQLGKIPAESIRAHAEGSHVVCECEPGDVLLMSPLLLHASSRSVTPSRRRIVHIEYAPPLALEKGLIWHEARAGTSLTIH
jgi:hypothetical protein